MAPRQRTKGGQQQSFMGCFIGEAGQSQAIGSLSHAGDGVNMAAEIQSRLAIARGFGFMAQPKLSKPEGGLLNTFASRQSPVMVASDQHNLCVQAIVQRLKIRPQAFGQPQWAVDQISKDDQAGGLPCAAERF